MKILFIHPGYLCELPVMDSKEFPVPRVGEFVVLWTNNSATPGKMPRAVTTRVHEVEYDYSENTIDITLVVE